MAAHVRIVEWRHFELEPDAAAVFAGSPAIRTQRVALVKKRIIKLLKLDRSILDIALTNRNRCGCTILERTATPTTANYVLANVTPARFRIDPEDRITAHVALMRRWNPVRQHGRERAENRVEHCRQRQTPTADRRRPYGAQDFSRWQ